jgi:hypothetical protein
MAEFPTIGISVEADIKDYTKDLNKAIALGAKADKALKDITAKVSVDSKGLDTLGGLLKGVKGKNVEIGVDADISKAESAIRSIDVPDAEIEVDADMSNADADVDSWVQTLLGVDAVINIVANLPIPTSIADIPLLSTILDTDKAVRTLTSRVNQDIPDAAGLIQGIFLNAWADSKEEIAENAALVLQTTGNVKDLAKNTEAVFAGAALTGEDFLSVLTAADKLVDTGLFSNIERAVDFIVAGFETGLNSSGDFLDSIDEYSVQFTDIGLSAEAGFSAVKQALDLGTRDVDKVVDLFKELGNAIPLALAAGSGDVKFDVLEILGQLDEAEAFAAGELAADEFFAGMFQAAEVAFEAGLINKGQLADLLGSQGEDVGLLVAIQLDPTQVADELRNSAGRAALQTQILFGDLGTAILTLERTITEELATTVSDAFDIPGKIAQFTAGITDFTSLIAGGMDIPEAIEIAFQLDGFAQTVHDLESALVNFAIGALQFIADLQSIGGNVAGAAATQTEVTRLATGQLPFDIVNAEDEKALENVLNRAISHGVEAANIVEIVQSQFDEAVSSGDLALANQIAQQIKNVTINADDPGTVVDTSGIDDLNRSAELFEAFGVAVENADLPGALEAANALNTEFGDVTALQAVTANAELMASAMGGVETKTKNAANAFTLSGPTIKEATNAIGATIASFSTIGALELGKIVLELDAILNRMDVISDISLVDAVNAGIAGALGGGGGGGNFDIPGEASGGVFNGMARIHENEILMTGPRAQSVAVLNSQTSNAIMSGLGHVLGGMGLGTGNTTNNSRGDTTINIMSSSGAEDIQAMNATASAMRGF